MTHVTRVEENSFSLSVLTGATVLHESYGEELFFIPRRKMCPTNWSVNMRLGLLSTLRSEREKDLIELKENVECFPF